MGFWKGFTLIGAAVAFSFGGAPLAAAAPPPAGLAHTQLTDFSCQQAFDPGARSVSVTAVMRPLPGTKALRVRFRLMRRTRRGRPFTQVTGSGLGSWVAPTNPTLGQRPGDVWIVNHPVVDLAGPATYHFVVGFRWIGAHGHVLSTVSRTSPNCYQSERRPDLVVRSITPRPIAGSPTRQRFVVAIHNRGATGAGSFEVSFTDQRTAQTRTVASLASGATIHETFTGPECAAGDSVTVVADPLHMVDDSNRANNTLRLRCTGS